MNRICGSGLEAINTAARWIESGDAEVVVAGGAENMSMLPYYLRKARTGYRLGDGTLEDGILHLLSDPFNRYHMGITAENLAHEYEVSRETQDEYALRSQERAAAAIAAGRFVDQIVPIEVKQGRETVVIDTDEHPRATSMEALGKLRPAFSEGGSVTAGNASGINDGAAAVVLMSASKAQSLGLQPKLRLVSRGEAGVRPEIMGSGPDPGGREGAASRRPHGRRPRRHRAERGVRVGGGGLQRGAGPGPRRRSTPTAAPSPSATRSARPAPSSR